MKSALLTTLLLTLALRAVSLAQNSPQPAAPPSASPGIAPAPIRSLDTFRNGLQRKIDEKRMHPPEPATKPVTIAEFERTMADNHLASDGKLAAILAGLTLTERANAARLSRWNAKSPGPQTRQVLLALADGSAFLPLPSDDIPAIPTPAPADQRQMMTAFANFLSKSLPSLPNFRATRLTTYFEDRPPQNSPLSTDPVEPDPLRNRPLHVVGTSTRNIAYLEGHEVAEKNTGFEDANQFAARFTTAGEFGPILYGVMMDAVESKLVWSRWESGSSSPLAVFSFDASKEKSHFSLKPPGAGKNPNQFVAYRGEIAIDPSEGTIVWLSVVAQPAPGDSLSAANIAVEYGSVQIGQQIYTCPVHGVALSKVPLLAEHTAKQNQPAPLQTQLNDISFQQFHVFRGEMRIAPEPAAQP